MPSVRRPKLPVRESRRELLPRDKLNSVRERRPRQSRVSICGGSIRSVLGNVFMEGWLLLFSGLLHYARSANGIMNFESIVCSIG